MERLALHEGDAVGRPAAVHCEPQPPLPGRQCAEAHEHPGSTATHTRQTETAVEMLQLCSSQSNQFICRVIIMNEGWGFHCDRETKEKSMQGASTISEMAKIEVLLCKLRVTPRLLWALEHVPALRPAASSGRALYGGVDSWLLWRLTAGERHLTDHSGAAATGFFDPFIVQWSSLASSLFGIPMQMLPRVCDCTADFGCTAPDLLGAPVPIRCLIADQAASTFGSCCFNTGDAKVTLGTGTFLNVNTGQTPHASVAGLYPLIGWKLDDEITYIVEGASNDTGSLINWAQAVGWLKSPEESEQLATSVKDSGGVFFIPAFSGLQAPVNNPQATAGFLGVTPKTERAHIVRAILESLVFRVLQLYEALKQEANYTCTSIRIDGGVSQNTFVAQLLADLTGVKVERSTTVDTSALGAGFLAGLATGVWKSKNDLCKLRKVRDVLEPRQEVRRRYENTSTRWREAMQRFLDWYPLPNNK